MTTKLEAINACLRGVGITSVGSEDDGPEAADAAKTVEEVSVTLQAEGWWFNKEYLHIETPNQAGEIKVSANVLDMVPTGDSAGLPLVILDLRVYDMINHTTDLRTLLETDSVEMMYTMRREFDALPEPAKQAIKFAAKRLYAQDEESDVSTYKMQNSDEGKAMAQLWKMEWRHARRNAFQNNGNATNISRIGGYNARLGISFTFPKGAE